MSDDFLRDLGELLDKNQRHITEYDTETLRALWAIRTRLDRYDFDGTATYAEILAAEALNTLFAHIQSAELADRFRNQARTLQGTIDELIAEEV